MSKAKNFIWEMSLVQYFDLFLIFLSIILIKFFLYFFINYKFTLWLPLVLEIDQILLVLVVMLKMIVKCRQILVL